MRRSVSIIAAVVAVGATLGAAIWVFRDSRPGSSRITIIEGLTVVEMIDSLAAQTDFAAEDFTQALLERTVESDLLSGPARDLRDWEGLLFPDTYEITDRDRPADILQLLADTAEARVASVDWTYLEEQGMSPYQGIVIASMIEREAALDSERPLIAGVIHNRLAIEMPLQIDATVVYALGGYPEGGLTYDDLEIDSPYNTYRIPGLPPTPISGVRLASLQAAAAPADTDYLFYVLAGTDGSHAFAATYEEFLVLKQQSQEAGLLP